MSEIVTFRPDERPDVEVLVDEVWFTGELRQWKQLSDGSWTGQVTWRSSACVNRIDTFPASSIREAG
ncbi:hypothetical protein [Nocardioides currus]|uniref:Uncharacterized protein n=1 Tax=Nocardioides currus TaxID=2133958 RepID=A0A2R7YSI6_9ACTN|nr:hypothetical protein [Nocardioides currus]PUA79204.1 hypothetical protein C7S10_20960 [Nocardioides currus]